jgi:hypothetical protein
VNDQPPLIAQRPGAEPPFPPTSRYAGLPLANMTAADGTEVTFVTRRLIPRPETLALAGSAQVALGDRLDLISARAYGRPDFDWRIADARGADDPDALVLLAGVRLPVPLPGPTHQADGDA